MQIELGIPGGKQQKYQNQKISLPTGYPGKPYGCYVMVHLSFVTFCLKKENIQIYPALVRFS